MALTAAEKKKKLAYNALDKNVIIEVIRISKKDGSVVKKEMPFGDWLVMKRTKGYYYTAYQKGFSKF